MKNVIFLLQLSPLSPSSQPHPVLMKQYVTLYNATAALTSIFMTYGFIPVCEGDGEGESKGRNLYRTYLFFFGFFTGLYCSFIEQQKNMIEHRFNAWSQSKKTSTKFNDYLAFYNNNSILFPFNNILINKAILSKSNFNI